MVKMRRKKNPQAGLDLFLDIVCNTFGGILFIALLIVILTRMIAQHDRRGEIATVPMDAFLSAENRLQTLIHEQERLRESARPFQQSTTAKQDWVERIVELESRRDAILKTKTAQSLTILETIRSVAEAEHLWNGTLQKHERLEAEYREKQRALFESVVKSNMQDIRLPQMRSSSKRKVALVLTGDKLFFWHRTSPDGSPHGLNDAQFTAFDHGTHRETLPKIWTGFPVSAKPDEQAVIAGQLRKFDASRVAFDVVVFRDSYSSFQYLRKVMAENGWEYTLFPIGPGESLIDRGGTPKPVQ